MTWKSVSITAGSTAVFSVFSVLFGDAPDLFLDIKADLRLSCLAVLGSDLRLSSSGDDDLSLDFDFDRVYLSVFSRL